MHDITQKVYSVGHSLAAYSVIWCMHTCYDKALVTVENALDCIPFNPGFILLKTIILRLCGRFDEATIWLENLSDNFYKLLDPKGDTQRSILGKLSVHETRSHLIKQWYLIRYDMAMQCLLEDKLETAIRIVYRSNLIKHYAESYMLLGDCFYKRDEIDLALESYLKCREKIRELELPFSRKNIDLVERIIDILNDRAEQAITKGQSKRAVEIADQALRILDEDKMPVHLLRLQRGRTLLAKARGLFQIESKQEVEKLLSCKTAADSLRFVRELDSDLYATLYSDKDIEGVIDRFAPPRQLPRSLKILMQFS
ncbi:uncharacterized protein LOC113465039 [Ceratina calcarata]|uniref:Uncharacterized protein LOC113465039 n=1 Tax=Ceratina calcarata TaxID=156304 RepID=A0AAJ7WF38_9HYME|nr:uncharacterized protein LOC113465039 [Ceratina calcarata]